MKHSTRTLTFSCGFALAAALATPDARAQVTELPQIVITAPAPIPSRAEVQPGDTVIVGDAFVPVTVVPQGAIERSPANTIADVMFTLPGLTSTTFGPLASRPVIRGLDNYRVRVQDSGIGSHDVSALGEDHAVPIDPLVSEQIEVVRGPATLRWGTQAIGGVVNAVTGRIPEMLRQSGMSAIFKGAASSVDRGLDGAIILEGVADRFAFHADYFRRQAGDYNTPQGVQANTRFRAEGAAIGGSWFFDQGWLGFSISRYASLYHVPGIEAAAADTRIDVDQLKFNSKGEWRPEITGIDSIRYWLGITDYKHDELGNENGIDGILSTFRNREQEARVEVQHMPLMTMLGALKGVVGAHFGHQLLSTEGEASELLAPARTVRIAGYVFEELKLSDTLRAQAAGRIESVRVKGTGAEFPAGFLPPPDDPTLFPADRTFVPMSVSFGLLKDLPWGLIASMTALYVERAPEAPELFSKGPHHASETFEIGNPDLKKEAARTVELGLKRPKGDFRFEASAYYTQYAGFIFKRLTGIECGHEFSTCGMPGETELTQIVYSQRDATFYGAEVMAQLDVMPLGSGILGVDGRYDFVRARFDDGSAVPRIPPQRIGGGAYWRDERWLARLSLLHAFAQNEIAANETPTAGYNLLRAEVSYRHKFMQPGTGPREIVLGIVGDNLLDEDIRNHVSFNKNEVLLPGRNIKGFFRTTF